MTPSSRAATRVGLLLVAGAILRVVYLLQYAQLPFLRAPIYDSVVYLRQARAIVQGRFDDAALVAFSPLYGYFLALIGGAYRVGPPIIAQLGLGLLNVYLIYRLVRSRHGEAAALVAAALYQGYGLLLSFESKLMSETLGLTLALLAMNTYCAEGSRAARLRYTLGSGVLVALSILCRASLLFCAPFFVLLALLPWSSPDEPGRRQRLARAAGIALGIGLVFAANGLWTRAHTGLFVPVILVSETVQKSTESGFNDDFAMFARGRQSGASALDVVTQAEVRLAQQRSGMKPAPAPRLWGVHVLGWLRGAPLKLWHTFADTEVSYDYGYFGERSEVRALSVLPVSFGMLVFLASIGALYLGLRGGGYWLLPYLPYLLGSLVTTTLFHSSSRYRLFMVLPLIVFAANAVVAALHERRRVARWSLGGAVALIVLLFAVRTLTYRLQDPAAWELRVAQSAMVLGDRTELSQRLARAARSAGNDAGTWQRIRLFAAAGGVPAPVGVYQ